jgi:hypothetical protein
VAITIGGNFEINVPGEYEFCGESMMGGRLFVSSMKVMECVSVCVCVCVCVCVHHIYIYIHTYIMHTHTHMPM